MKKWAVPLPLATVAVLIIGAVVSITSKPANVFAQGRSSYAEDRAAIEDLQARYLFALDFHDPDLYVSTFTEDGVLDYGSGEVKGRQAIKDVPECRILSKLLGNERPRLATTFQTLSLKSRATRRQAVPIGSTTPMTTPSGAASSMGLATTKTS